MKLLGLLSILLFTACAHQYPDFPQEVPKPKEVVVACDTDSAYEVGMNDGMYRLPMNSSVFTKCDSTLQPKLRKSYKDGYHKGLEVKIPEKTEVPPPAPHPGGVGYPPRPGVNIHIGSGYSRAWMCELSPFVKNYKAFGATEQEAAYNVEKLCEKDNHSMHCDEPKCVPTR